MRAQPLLGDPCQARVPSGKPGTPPRDCGLPSAVVLVARQQRVSALCHAHAALLAGDLAKTASKPQGA